MIASFVRQRVATGALLGARALFPSTVAAQDADIIMRNGRIWTGDTLRPYADALAIRAERLIAVGSAAQVESHRASGTRVIDLRGRFVTPGFIDDHTHFNQAGALLIGANLLDVSTPGPLAQRVKDAVRRMSPGHGSPAATGARTKTHPPTAPDRQTHGVRHASLPTERSWTR